jgi:hypothetical protein
VPSPLRRCIACPVTFGASDGPLFSASGIPGQAGFTQDQPLAGTSAGRRHQCEGFFPKRLPNLSYVRNMRVLGSDIAATKQVAE